MADRPDDSGHTPPADDGQAFAERVSRYLNGAPDPTGADLARLNDELAASDAARSTFVRMARLHGLLTEHAVTGRAAIAPAEPHPGASLHDAIVGPAIRDEDVAEEDGEPTATAPATWAAPPPRRRPWFARGGWRVAVGTTAVAIAVAVAWLGRPTLPVRTAAVPTVGPEPVAVPIVPPSVDPPAVAAVVRLGAAVDARWDEATGGPPAVNAAVPDRSLTLAAGWVRLDFPTGTTVVVEAPARFRVRSAAEVELVAGRAAAEVPVAGHGFAIVTALARVVDLGTDFGVAVGGDGRSDVAVFKGTVSIAPTAASRPAEVLTQGDGRRLPADGGPAVAVAADPAAFVRREQFARWVSAAKPAGDAAGRHRAWVEQVARDPSLALYYPMLDRGPAVTNRAAATAGRYDVAFDGTTPTWADGRLPGTAALDFDPVRAQRLVLPEFPLSRTGRMTGVAWVFARSIKPWGSIAKNWGSDRCGQFHLGLSSDACDLEVELDGSRPDGPNVREGADHPFPVGRWVHVAFTTDGKVARLYRDGKEVGSAPSRPLEADPPIKSLAFGCKTGDDGLTPLDNAAAGFWDGRIGGFALFDRALSADEVARLAADGPPVP